MIGPVEFVREVLVDPETNRRFELYPAQEQFLREAFTPGLDGGLPYAELVFGAPKKSGKTTMSAFAVLYTTAVLGGKFAEGYVVANDLEQAASRVFRAASRIVKASPMLKHDARVTQDVIEFRSTGGTIQAIASEYKGAAGTNPTIVVADELWGFMSESAHRLWDEMVVPAPTRTVSVRLTTTYAGFSGESDLLERLYHRGLRGERIGPDLYRQPGMLMFWSHEPVAPWQTPEWLEQMRQQLRPNAYLRMIENRFVSGESSFVDEGWWDGCVDRRLTPVVADSALRVWVGVDASVKRDQTAIVAVTWDRDTKKVRLVWHKTFQPSPENPLDFETTVENTLLGLRDRFRVKTVRFDPYQLVASSQRLKVAGVPMVEFSQTVPNLTEASSNLYELIKGRNLLVYPDDAMRLAIRQSVAIETARGWRITKEKTSHKIDVVVALAQAALGAVQDGPRGEMRVAEAVWG